MGPLVKCNFINTFVRKHPKIYLRLMSISSSQQIESVRLAYTSYGTGKIEDYESPPLIIMHGLLGSKMNWNSVSKALHGKTKPRRQVIAVDARNHGESPHTINNSYAHLAEDVKDLMDHLGIPKATFLGHSMGGRAMMVLALKYPQIVSSLAIADISPVQSSPNLNSMLTYFDVMKSIRLNAKDSIQEARKSADYQMANVVRDKNLRNFLLTNLVKSEKGFLWKVNIEALATNFETHIAHFPYNHVEGLKYHGPTLFIGGGISDYIRRDINHEKKSIRLFPTEFNNTKKGNMENLPETFAKILPIKKYPKYDSRPNRKSDEPAIKEFFPNAELKFIEGAGHWLHADKPNEFISELLQFLNTH